MAELAQLFGNDLNRDDNGRLVLADSLAQSEYRLIRRLMTNAKDYLWHPEYGAGLPKQVGSTTQPRAIMGIIRSQLTLEASVAQTPLPAITVTPISNGLTVTIRYTSTETGQPTELAFDVTP